MRKRSKYWNTMVDILDGQFPKGKCAERGRALVMLAYIEMMLNGVDFDDEGQPTIKKEGKKSCGICRFILKNYGFCSDCPNKDIKQSPTNPPEKIC